MAKIMGVDPGLAQTGVGVVHGRKMQVFSYGLACIQTDKALPLADRLERIYQGVFQVLDREKPDFVVVEDIFSLQVYPKSGITLGKVCGVVLLAAKHWGVSAVEIPVREVKKIMTGNGSAGKAQVEKAVRRVLNREAPICPDHVSDALGLALVGLFRFEQLRPGPDNPLGRPSRRKQTPFSACKTQMIS